MVAGVLGVAWLTSVLVATRASSDPLGLAPRAAELSAAAALAAAFACRTRTHSPVNVGATAATAAVLAVLTTGGLAQRWTFLPSIGTPAQQGHWWTVAALGAVFAAWSSRDPAAVRPLGRRPGRRSA